MDVTKKTAEDALRKSEEHFRLLYEMSPLGYLSLDSDGNLLEVNPAWLSLLGYEKQDVIGLSFAEFLAGGFPELFKERFPRFKASGEIWSVPFVMIRKDSSHIDVEIDGKIGYNPDGSFKQTHCILRDVTKRKKAEEALEMERYRLAKAQEIGIIGTWEIDLVKNILIWTEENHNIFGIPDGTDVTYEKFLECVHPGDREYVNTEWVAAVNGKPYDIEHRIIVNGKIKWVREKAELTFDDNRKPIRAVGVTQDITERKKVEKLLHKEKDFAESIVQTAQAIILVLDLKGHILSFNPYMEEVSGYTIEETRGKDWFNTFLPKQECLYLKELFLKATHEIETKGTVNPIITKNGELRYIEWNNKTLRDSDGELTGILSIGQDITERKQAEDQLLEAKQQAETANIAKSQFLANMSHEIRTPINVITGFADLLLAEEDPNEQKMHVKLIQEASKSLISLIDEILDISRIEAGKLDINTAVCSITKLLDGIDVLMQSLAMEKGLQFEIFKSSCLPNFITTDGDRVRQCLINLISNAIKFTQEGHVHLKVSTEHKDDKLFIRFDIEDTGIGIPADKQGAIFDSFSQADASHTRKYGGAGLGLAISKKIANLLDGDVSFTSEENKGSVFSLVIPSGIDLDSPSLLNKDEVSKVDKPKSLDDLKFDARVLLAEDNEGCQILTRRTLQRYGLDPVIVANGKDAIEKVHLEQFDLILMDMQMPYLNGFEATKKLREEGVTTPIIALTAYAMQGDMEKCINAGCDDYISKPVDNEELVRVLNKYATTVD